MTRRAVVAGQFYPLNKAALSGDLDGLIPGCDDKIDAIGAVVPHAGYVYSGSVAGETFARMAGKDSYIILGPNHTGYGRSFSSSSESWETPLGNLEIDNELLDAIKKETNLVEDDISAHIAEHSIEVQLPFIKKINPEAKIVPITIKHEGFKELKEVADALSNAVKKTGKRTMIIASSDMTHYESREDASRKDNIAIEKMLALDAEGLFNAVRENNISMCGYIPSVIMLMAAKNMGARKAELIKYTDSGAITGDTDQVVGYAGITVY